VNEKQYTELYFRDLELNLVAFNRLLDCEQQIRALAQIAYDIGFNAAVLGETRTCLDDWEKMPKRYIQIADSHVLRSAAMREREQV
jgi:hypothetical protein